MKMKKLFNEFKTFAVKGNMLDLAIGIIIGGAFTVLVTSIVGNVAMPLAGMLGSADFASWVIELPRVYAHGESATIMIGLFLNDLVNFIVVALIVFIFVKVINRHRKKQEDAPVEPSKEEILLTEIRDLLKEQAMSAHSLSNGRTVFAPTNKPEQSTDLSTNHHCNGG